MTTLVPIVLKIGTTRFRRAMKKLITSGPIKNIVDVFHTTSVEILESKKKALREGDQALADQIGRGKDIISILCTISFIFHLWYPLRRLMKLVRANMEASEEDKLSDNELLGQVT
jgi:hypothetical protein